MFISPRQKPQQHGFKEGDTHLVVNAASKTIKGFAFNGEKLFEYPCLAEGQDPNWRNNSGDTPPGLYKLGEIYNDYAQVGDFPEYDRTLMSYGWLTFDMIDLEGNEDGNGRAGICLHGGGSGCGWPGAWEPYQALYPTLGCLRMHNSHLMDLLPLMRQGTVFISVYQDED